MIDRTGNNCFMLACEKNDGHNSLAVIKYIRSRIGDDIYLSNFDTYNAFVLACKNNKNLEVIKYLMNEFKINENFYKSSVTNAVMFNKNHSIAKYLIEETNIEFNSYEIAHGFKNYNDMNKLITELSNGANYERFNKLLVGVIDYVPSKLDLKDVNPLIDITLKEFSKRIY